MKTLKQIFLKNIPFWIFSFISVFLLVVAFFTPPPYVIDNSVIIAVSEIFAFAALYTVIEAIDKGVNAHLKKGDVELGIESKKEKEPEDN